MGRTRLSETVLLAPSSTHGATDLRICHEFLVHVHICTCHGQPVYRAPTTTNDKYPTQQSKWRRMLHCVTKQQAPTKKTASVAETYIYIYIYNADDLRRWLRIISWKLLEDGANQSEPPDQKAEKHRPITSSNPRNPKNAATDPFKTPPAPCGAKGTRLSASYSENAVIVMNTTSSPCRS